MADIAFQMRVETLFKVVCRSAESLGIAFFSFSLLFSVSFSFSSEHHIDCGNYSEVAHAARRPLIGKCSSSSFDSNVDLGLSEPNLRTVRSSSVYRDSSTENELALTRITILSFIIRTSVDYSRNPPLSFTELHCNSVIASDLNF